MGETIMMMKFDIPKECHIRWQAALAVLEDLQEDEEAPFDQGRYADNRTLWEKTNGCGTAACFAGYISVAPYCKALDYPKNDRGYCAVNWLVSNLSYDDMQNLYGHIFHHEIDEGSRAKTLAFLEKRLKTIFKNSTGKNLVAPLTFWY
jgi:hypothetical protein